MNSSVMLAQTQRPFQKTWENTISWKWCLLYIRLFFFKGNKNGGGGGIKNFTGNQIAFI